MLPLLLNGEQVHLSPQGSLWWPEHRLLVVADMHLEKGSSFAVRGQMLPPYDSAATLAKLAALVAQLCPLSLIALGDSFHDIHAGERLVPELRQTLHGLAGGLRMIWITGNHDPELPEDLPGERHDVFCVGGLSFRHEPQAGVQAGEVAGHLHPVAKVANAKGRVRARAFISDGARLILPAFGAYAGGLNCRDQAISSLFCARTMTAYICGRTQIFAVERSKLML
jgi:uncharacterized protein